MIRRALVLLALLAAPASAQPFLRHCFGTIGQLPAVAASAPGRLCTVSNGASATDCTVGGGSTSVLCRDNGSAWVAVGGSGGGGSATVESVALTMPNIFSVSGSPITTTGTLAVTLGTQAAGRVWAGPASGADAAPAFRDLVATDIPTPLTSSTSGNAGTATALAANPANCAGGSAPRGVDASGAAEDCTAYLTDITGQTIGDLSDVDETGAATGEALVSDGAGAWSPSAAAVCLSNGTNCPASSSAFSAITSGTNTSAAMVCGAGCTLKKTSTGTIDASAIDADGDGNRELFTSTVSTHPSICLSPNDGGVCQARLSNYVGGALYVPYIFTGAGVFLSAAGPESAESHWWIRPLTASRLSITSSATTTSFEIGNDGTNQYVDLAGVRNYGALASPPTCSADGQIYTDTTEGSGLAAHCVCLDGTWQKTVGAGTCGT